MIICSEQLNSVQSSILEAACVTFLSRVIACSAVNQKTLSTVMCQIISAQSAPSRGWINTYFIYCLINYLFFYDLCFFIS